MEPDWEAEERVWQAMAHVTVFNATTSPEGLPWTLYGFRELGNFFGLRGEWLSGAWKFPHKYNGWTVEIIGQITRAQLAQIRKKASR